MHAKDYSSDRAAPLAARVVCWVAAPRIPGRQLGWVTTEATAYIRPGVRIAVRGRKKHGPWGIGVLISPRDPPTSVTLTDRSPSEWVHPDADLRASV